MTQVLILPCYGDSDKLNSLSKPKIIQLFNGRDGIQKQSACFTMMLDSLSQQIISIETEFSHNAGNDTIQQATRVLWVREVGHPGVTSGHSAKQTSDEQNVPFLPLKPQRTGEVNPNLQIQGYSFKKYQEFLLRRSQRRRLSSMDSRITRAYLSSSPVAAKMKSQVLSLCLSPRAATQWTYICLFSSSPQT